MISHADRAATIHVSIVEDDGRVRTSLARLIERAPGMRCLSEHGSAEEALEVLPGLRPDVVMMDVKLPGKNGVDCVRQLKPQLPQTQIIMLTVYQDNEVIFDALAAGATGYLLKRTPGEELIAGIREVHGGGSPMSSQIARKVVQSFREAPPTQAADDGDDTLTPREREVLDLLAKGYLYKEIASRLGVGYDTVHSHIRNIYDKLQVHTRTQATAAHLARTLAASAGRAGGR